MYQSRGGLFFMLFLLLFLYTADNSDSSTAISAAAIGGIAAGAVLGRTLTYRAAEYVRIAQDRAHTRPSAGIDVIMLLDASVIFYA